MTMKRTSHINGPDAFEDVCVSINFISTHQFESIAFNVTFDAALTTSTK